MRLSEGTSKSNAGLLPIIMAWTCGEQCGWLTGSPWRMVAPLVIGGVVKLGGSCSPRGDWFGQIREGGRHLEARRRNHLLLIQEQSSAAAPLQSEKRPQGGSSLTLGPPLIPDLVSSGLLLNLFPFLFNVFALCKQSILQNSGGGVLGKLVNVM